MDSKLSDTAWYVLYTASRCEKKVAKVLEDSSVNFFLPLLTSSRVWSDRIKMVEMPLFSSYIFVNCSLSKIQSFLQIQHVSYIVRMGGEPVAVRAQEIEDIRTFLSIAKEGVLCEGDEAEVVCGEMKSVKGCVQKIGKKYVILYVESLNAKVCVSLQKLVKK